MAFTSPDKINIFKPYQSAKDLHVDPNWGSEQLSKIACEGYKNKLLLKPPKILIIGPRHFRGTDYKYSYFGTQSMPIDITKIA